MKIPKQYTETTQTPANQKTNASPNQAALTQNREIIIDELHKNLSKALAYLNLCIQACHNDKADMYDMGIVLEDTKVFMNNLLELLDQV